MQGAFAGNFSQEELDKLLQRTQDDGSVKRSRVPYDFASSLVLLTFDDRVERASFLGPGHHVPGRFAPHFLLRF